ncbi:MAG TPA: RNA pseudouridine synthase [Bacteroidales bacterium]|nr:MAG: RNA pseudouridine synthase [Bacteroidetes bacterium GWE2_42_24]OFY25002.1 MAG: RNA pseudouridine synthase [Bacteroidetes bacterium GWF2_43_11]PKP15981.1 MAG: RNA pseudouridine synthase [Bacteroidetes bacterium HGW-Bacteroidetes-22]HAQ64301.1 RNA pseudouridine synthase [Bacteroidales bacterium]HBZ65648.1 RNA pseudouridine synthase [Bacteroidales bacterium]
MSENHTNPPARPSLQSRVLYEDNHLLIINKLPSEIVQGDKSGDIPLSEIVREYIRVKYNKPGNAFLGVVHRLDRPVSGAVIFARTSKGLTRLNEMLRERTIRKTYWAVVKNLPSPDNGHLMHFMVRNEQQNKSYCFDDERKNSSRAELDYRLIGRSDRYFLLEVDLHTGRHHQIRAQLAHIGCPIKGDLKYGFDRSNPGGFIHLHARSVSFEHPVSKVLIHIVASPPADPVWDVFKEVTT